MLSMLTRRRRRRLADQASESRESTAARRAAWGAVIVYNLVGLVDIWSTSLAIGLGVAEEANPVMRAAMDHFGPGWIAAKLFLQAVISVMVLWFPHRIVLTMFMLAVAFNAGIVWSNLRIAGLF